MIPKSTPKLGSISSDFGRLLGKIYLFLTPSKTNRRVPSQQGAPTTCNLTYWEVFPGDITSKFGCGHRAKFSPSAEERFLTNSTYHLFSTTNPLRDPQLPISRQQFTYNDILFFPNLPASKNWPLKQIFLGTGPLGAPANNLHLLTFFNDINLGLLFAQD